ADRNDHRVLDLLGLGEPEDLGAEILRPVRPAYAAAGDHAEAEMKAVNPRAVQEDIAIGTRRRQALDGPAIELQRALLMRRAVFAEPEEIGPYRRGDDVHEAADDAVFVEAVDSVEPGDDLCRPDVLGAGAAVRCKAGVEEPGQGRGELGMADQGR